MSRLSKAIALAADVHEHQDDKGGEPYILHPIRVMEDAMRVEDGSEDVGIVAVLHDVLEDNQKFGHQHLRNRIKREFGEMDLALLDILTKVKGEDYLTSYIPRIINSETYATTIKMADLRDNMNILRQPTLSDKDLLRIQKYHIAYRLLRASRPPY